jgi:NitT/TauT family transport system substrate-binding protein
MLLVALFLSSGTAGAAGQATLRVGYLPITHSLALVVADKLNAGKYRNFKLELVKFSSWPELLDAYNGGKIQAASELLVLALAGAERGVPESVVALSHRHGDFLTVAKDIKSVRDLKGKRVAIARALAVEPSVLFMDESFTALDAFTRIHLQDEPLHIWKEKHTPSSSSPMTWTRQFTWDSGWC